MSDIQVGDVVRQQNGISTDTRYRVTRTARTKCMCKNLTTDASRYFSMASLVLVERKA